MSLKDQKLLRGSALRGHKRGVAKAILHRVNLDTRGAVSGLGVWCVRVLY